MGVAKILTRVFFGVGLSFVGIAHYQDAANYAESVGRGLGPLEPLGMVWGYLLPGLMIVGGVLIAVGLFTQVGALLAGLALLSIPAGLMLKSVLSGLSLNDTMPPAMNAWVWVLVYLAAIRGCECHGCMPHLMEKKPAVPAKAAPMAPKPAVVPPKPAMIAKKPAGKIVGKKR